MRSESVIQKMMLPNLMRTPNTASHYYKLQYMQFSSELSYFLVQYRQQQHIKSHLTRPNTDLLICLVRKLLQPSFTHFILLIYGDSSWRRTNFGTRSSRTSFWTQKRLGMGARRSWTSTIGIIPIINFDPSLLIYTMRWTCFWFFRRRRAPNISTSPDLTKNRMSKVAFQFSISDEQAETKEMYIYLLDISNYCRILLHLNNSWVQKYLHITQELQSSFNMFSSITFQASKFIIAKPCSLQKWWWRRDCYRKKKMLFRMLTGSKYLEFLHFRDD